VMAFMLVFYVRLSDEQAQNQYDEPIPRPSGDDAIPALEGLAAVNDN
jgi:hypothetical protein